MNTQLKSAIAGVFLAVLFSCKPPAPRPSQPGFERILQDTANNDRAKWDLEQLAHYNSICKGIGLNRLYDGVDSFEVRAWRQFSVFGMAADEEIYSLRLIDSTVNLTFYRVYCTNDNEANFRTWDAFTDAKIDSFVAVSKTFPKKIADSIDLPTLWNLKAQSALGIPDAIGFLDGTTTSIELASPFKYKLIRHHVANAYYEKTKMKEIKDYMDAYNKLIVLFQSNSVYVR